VAEARQVDGDDMRFLGKPTPDLVEGEQAFRAKGPGKSACASRSPALGEADVESIDGPETAARWTSSM